tara:strand:- start:39 stop:263 length:225 start_codon:yes stop_codon:yes gene_type:complete
MTYRQYCQIESLAGGIGCTNRQFIKACIEYIIPQARHHYIYRSERHKFIRKGLQRLEKSRSNFYKVNIGNFKEV